MRPVRTVDAEDGYMMKPVRHSDTIGKIMVMERLPARERDVERAIPIHWMRERSQRSHPVRKRVLKPIIVLKRTVTIQRPKTLPLPDITGTMARLPRKLLATIPE